MNGWDGRLDRMAAGVIMLMEALGDPSFAHKFDYCVTGHSGTRLGIVNWQFLFARTSLLAYHPA
jgi:hypothetical protein